MRERVFVVQAYLPFSQAGRALLFHLLSKLYEHTSVMVTTDLTFGEWPSIFGDAKMCAALQNAQVDFPTRKITVNLALANLSKESGASICRLPWVFWRR